MTTNYSRSQIYDYADLSAELQAQVKSDYGFEDSDCYSSSYVVLKATNYTNPENNKSYALPLSMFMRADKSNKFTHGIYSTSAFDGYFVTFDRRNEYAVIAHKYF